MRRFVSNILPFIILISVIAACSDSSKYDPPKVQTEKSVKKNDAVTLEKDENKTKPKSPAYNKEKKNTYKYSAPKTESKPKPKQKPKAKVKPKKEQTGSRYRIGAICCDGSRSNATGRGACSWHGGVCEWLYNY